MRQTIEERKRVYKEGRNLSATKKGTAWGSLTRRSVRLLAAIGRGDYRVFIVFNAVFLSRPFLLAMDIYCLVHQARDASLLFEEICNAMKLLFCWHRGMFRFVY